MSFAASAKEMKQEGTYPFAALGIIKSVISCMFLCRVGYACYVVVKRYALLGSGMPLRRIG